MNLMVEEFLETEGAAVECDWGVLKNTERKSDVFDFSLHSFFRPLYMTLQEYTRDIQDKILEQRRLPGTIPPDNSHNLTLLTIKRDLL